MAILCNQGLTFGLLYQLRKLISFFTFSGNEIEKRGASQYYLLHFGMPGSGARAPAQQKTRSYKVLNL